MASEIYFKFGYEKDTSKVKFSGSQLTLKELKERIIEIKQLRLAPNVDLKVVDASDGSKEYIGDDVYIPKFTSVIVSRKAIIPISGGGGSSNLISRPSTSSSMSKLTSDSQPHTQSESKGESSSTLARSTEGHNPNANFTTGDDDESSSNVEEEMRKLREQRMKLAARDAQSSMSQNAPGNYIRGPGHQYQQQGNLSCKICGKSGHFAHNCPHADKSSAHNKYSNAGPADRTKVHGVPDILLKRVTVQDGIETIAPSTAEHQRLIKDGGRSSLLSGFDMSKVPGHLKCSLSGRILEDAVILPCCRKIISDSAARTALLDANLQCPLCKRSGISPDELRPDLDVRKSVENFIKDIENPSHMRSGIADENGTNLTADPILSSQFTGPVSIPPVIDPFFGVPHFGVPGMPIPGMQPPGMNIPGYALDPFGVMLPFDSNLVPWHLMPQDIFPPPIPFQVFKRERAMQRSFQNSEYDRFQKPASSRPRCIHGRSEGYCSRCNVKDKSDDSKYRGKEDETDNKISGEDERSRSRSPSLGNQPRQSKLSGSIERNRGRDRSSSPVKGRGRRDDRERSASRGKDRTEGRSQGRESTRDHKYDTDRNIDRERDHGRNKGRDRDRNRSRDKDRERDREKDRDGDRGREQDRIRDRDNNAKEKRGSSEERGEKERNQRDYEYNKDGNEITSSNVDQKSSRKDDERTTDRKRARSPDTKVKNESGRKSQKINKTEYRKVERCRSDTDESTKDEKNSRWKMK